MTIDRLAELARRNPALRRALRPAAALRQRWLTRHSAEVATVLDRLAGLLAEDPVLRVEEFDGLFAFSAQSRLFRRVVEQGEYEPALTRRCVELLDPARDAIDVGANIGFHSVLFARHLPHGRVLAVEPTRNAQHRLRRNLALNGVAARVVVFDGAASDVAGAIEMKTIAGREEFSSAGEMAHPSIAGQHFSIEHVEARTLDQLVAEHGLKPGIVKVDVEGFEHRVFEGARDTLARHRPVVVSELSDYLLRKNGSSARAIVQQFESLGYRVVDPLHPGETPGSREFGDMVCLPAEHASLRA